MASLAALLRIANGDGEERDGSAQPQPARLGLFGTQKAAVECTLQFHLASASRGAETTSSSDDCVVDLITQSRLLVHPDNADESVPEEAVERDAASASRSGLDAVVHASQIGAAEAQVPEQQPSPTREEKKQDNDETHLHRVLYVSRRPGSYAVPSGEEQEQQLRHTHLNHQSCVVLLAGDRAAGKTTLAAVASGLSLATQRVLRLHATALSNVWFDPGAEDMRYFVNELSDVGATAAAAAPASPNRKLPLLPSQLCITSLVGLTEDVELFMDDDELHEEALEAGMLDVVVTDVDDGGGGDANAEDADRQSLLQRSRNSSSLFTSIQLLEVGGDLLEMMALSRSAPDRVEKDSAKTSPNASALIRAATNAVRSAMSCAYFFDVSKFCSADHFRRSVHHFIFFLQTRSGGGDDERSSAPLTLLLVASRVQSLRAADRETDDCCAACARFIADTFAVALESALSGKQFVPEASTSSCCCCCSQTVAWTRAFLAHAHGAARRILACSSSSALLSCRGVLVPDFAAASTVTAFDARAFSKLEDVSMEILRMSLSAAAAALNVAPPPMRPCALFRPLQEDSPARIARMLNACLRYSLAKLYPKWLEMTVAAGGGGGSREDPADAPSEHSSVRRFLEEHHFVFTPQHCVRALLFAQRMESHEEDEDDEDEEDGNNDAAHGASCPCCSADQHHHREPTKPPQFRASAVMMPLVASCGGGGGHALMDVVPTSVLGPVTVSRDPLLGSLAAALSRSVEFCPDAVLCRAVPLLLARLRREQRAWWPRASSEEGDVDDDSGASSLVPLHAPLTAVLIVHDEYERRCLLEAFAA